MKQPKGSINIKLEFQRALLILNKRITTVDDLLMYWHFSGPCLEDRPEIENI
jgi:hypothetical protein